MASADRSYCEVQLDAEENYYEEFHKEQDVVQNRRLQTKGVVMPLVKNHQLRLCQLSRSWATEC